MTVSASRSHLPVAIADGQSCFRDLLDDVDLVAVLVNPRAQITYCNPYFSRITGWSFEELSGQRWRDVFAPSFAAEMVPLAAEHSNDSLSGWRFEEQILTRCGEQRNIRWNNFELRDASGRATAAAGIGEDTTQLRKIERAVMDCNARQRCDLERDLHDGLGQDLAGIALLAKSLATTAHRDQLKIAHDLARLSTFASNAIESCRRIAREFSPSSDLQGGLIHALRQLTSMPQNWHGASTKFVVCQTAPIALSAQASDHVYRIAQEWLADALQHAAANSILVSLNVRPAALRLEILDDGNGAAALGKPSEMLRHRAALLEAQLLVEPRHSGGMRLALNLGQPA
jgi:PAS domain S-box-containing protein